MAGLIFTAEEDIRPGTFVTVRLTGTMDGELTGEAGEEGCGPARSARRGRGRRHPLSSRA